MRAVALIRRAADLPIVGAAAKVGETVALIAAADDAETRSLLAAAKTAGAARLVRVWDPSLDAADYLGVAYVLAAAVRAAVGELAATLIVAGDRGRGSVGPAVAERLGVPLLGQALTVGVHEGKLRVERRSRGLVRTLTSAPPALIGLLVDEATPPVLHESAAENGAAVDIESWTLSKVGMSAAELAYRRRFAPAPAPGMPAASPPLRLPDAAALVARLRADGLVPRSRDNSSSTHTPSATGSPGLPRKDGG
jgi:electron transfer flavoprotein alpha/beta subunit